jgi:hypothetical protein
MQQRAMCPVWPKVLQIIKIFVKPGDKFFVLTISRKFWNSATVPAWYKLLNGKFEPSPYMITNPHTKPIKGKVEINVPEISPLNILEKLIQRAHPIFRIPIPIEPKWGPAPAINSL